MIEFTREEALKYRDLIHKAAKFLEDTDAASAPMIFERWEIDVDYSVGDRVRFGDKLYKVLIAHKSQDTWKPDISPSLFAEVLIPDPTVIPEWVQPSSTNPYMLGDKVRHNGKIWISTYDYNVWEPGVYGWEETTE